MQEMSKNISSLMEANKQLIAKIKSGETTKEE